MQRKSENQIAREEREAVHYSDGRVMLPGPHKRTERQTTEGCSKVDVFTSIYIPAELPDTAEVAHKHGFPSILLESQGGRPIDLEPEYFYRSGGRC